MSYRATFTGFTGAQYICEIRADDIENATAICADHMCAGDIVTIELSSKEC